MPGKRKATLAAVSRKAGVSVSTASRVLSGSVHHVAPATRERVLRAARQVGFAPAAVARATKRRRPALIGLIVGDIGDPYYGEMARACEDAARRHGYMSMVASGDRDPEKELQQLRLFLAQDAAGVILASDTGEVSAPELRAEITAALQADVRLVAIGTSSHPVPRVRVDTEAASAELTSYLVSLGHRRVVYFGGPEGMVTSEQRERGYRASMEAAGFTPETRRAGATAEAGAGAAMALLAEGAQPDAIICFNDEAASGVLIALDDAHVAVPERVSLAGMGNSASARLAGIASVDLASAGTVERAVERILSSELGDDLLVPHRLVPRGSVKPRA
jgi:LacI family transcriptional regulator